MKTLWNMHLQEPHLHSMDLRNDAKKKKKRWQKNIQNLILPKINQYDLILQTSMIQAKKKRKEMAYF